MRAGESRAENGKEGCEGDGAMGRVPRREWEWEGVPHLAGVPGEEVEHRVVVDLDVAARSARWRQSIVP